MANNTKRQFLNRVEIYSDNAGREGWKGTYDYTKIGSITKETSDKSGDGYKQNNSTTYAKNKVIWYCIKLNLGSGDVDKTQALTVVDKIPDGMKLATDNNSLSNYRIAADLDTAPGNKYTGKIKKSPSENIYSLVSNGVTYWSIDTSDPNQLTIKVLPVTLNKLIDPNKTTDHYVEIRYALQLMMRQPGTSVLSRKNLYKYCHMGRCIDIVRHDHHAPEKATSGKDRQL